MHGTQQNRKQTSGAVGLSRATCRRRPAHFALATPRLRPSVPTFPPMISWIQRTFQQHFKAVFIGLLAITIASFIFTIGAAGGIGRADRTVLKREFFGYNL